MIEFLKSRSRLYKFILLLGLIMIYPYPTVSVNCFLWLIGYEQGYYDKRKE